MSIRDIIGVIYGCALVVGLVIIMIVGIVAMIRHEATVRPQPEPSNIDSAHCGRNEHGEPYPWHTNHHPSRCKLDMFPSSYPEGDYCYRDRWYRVEAFSPDSPPTWETTPHDVPAPPAGVSETWEGTYRRETNY